MTKAKLYTEVKKEAAALLIHATEEERGKLDFKMLIASDVRNCIYGKMTGNCYSDRAGYLIQECCSVFVKGSTLYSALKNYRPTTAFNRELVWSPIEVYICRPEAKIKELIKYLKGEIKTFKP